MSGKSHLASYFKKQNICFRIDAKDVNENTFFKFKTKEALIIENLNDKYS